MQQSPRPPQFTAGANERPWPTTLRDRAPPRRGGATPDGNGTLPVANWKRVGGNKIGKMCPKHDRDHPWSDV